MYLYICIRIFIKIIDGPDEKDRGLLVEYDIFIEEFLKLDKKYYYYYYHYHYYYYYYCTDKQLTYTYIHI